MYFLLDVCRLCLSYKNEFYDLCCDDIMEKLVACISDLEFEDHVPSVICEQCLEQVDLYYEFRNKCLRSEFIINNYVEKLLGGNKNSQLRSKLQVKLARNFSPSKIPSKVKLSRPTLLADSTMRRNLNKTVLEDSKLEEVHTDITERVKLRKRCQPTRTISIGIATEEIEKNTSSIDGSNNIDNIPVGTVQRVNQNNVNTTEHSQALLTTENLEKNLPYGLNSSLSTSVSEESNCSTVSSIITESLEKSLLNTSHLPETRTSIQNKNCHLQASFNPNHELKEPPLLSISLKRKLSNEPDSLNSNITQEDSNKLKVNLDQNQTCSQEVPVTSNEDQIYSKEVPISLNQNVESNVNDNITSIDEKPPVYEIEDDDDDPPDEINRMMLLESLLRPGHHRSKLRVPALKIPIKPNYTQPNGNQHISVMEHNYSGHIYLPNQKRLKVTTGPTIGCSSSSDEIDVEGLSENEETKYPDENVVKIMKERIRRNTIRSCFKDLICVVPTNMLGTRQSKVDVLNGSEYYIKLLEKEALQSMDKVQSLKEKNLQLKERLNEIRKQR